jgi:hypothetical protein
MINSTKAAKPGLKTTTRTTSSEMRSKHKSRLLIPVLVISIALVSATILLTTTADNAFAQRNNNATPGSTPSSNTNPSSTTGGSNLNCQSIAAKIAGISIPNPSKICNILILRQSPTIIGPGNMNMNKFSTINSIVEVASMSDLMNKSGTGAASASPIAANNTTGQKVFVMGEFGLLEPQLVPMIKAGVGSNWTILAVHNHMVLEKPKMIFVHWSAQGDPNTITNQIKNVLLTVSKVPNTGTARGANIT